MLLAYIVLSPLALESITFIGVLLATIGSLFLAYDLLGRENGPLRWFTLVLTCGFVSALVFVPVAIIEAFLLGGFKGGFNLFIILPLILFGGLLGFYTVILVDFSPSNTRPPSFRGKGACLDWHLHSCSGSWAFSWAPNFVFLHLPWAWHAPCS
jgi:hypothetical protein